MFARGIVVYFERLFVISENQPFAKNALSFERNGQTLRIVPNVPYHRVSFIKEKHASVEKKSLGYKKPIIFANREKSMFCLFPKFNTSNKWHLSDLRDSG